MTSIIVTGSEYDRIAAGQRTALVVKADQDWQAGDIIRIETMATADKTEFTKTLGETVSAIFNTDVSAIFNTDVPDRPPLKRVITHVLRDDPGVAFGYMLVTFKETNTLTLRKVKVRFDPAGASAQFADTGEDLPAGHTPTSAMHKDRPWFTPCWPDVIANIHPDEEPEG